MRGISEQAQTKYQDLIFRDADFLTFFKESTPLPEIGELNIGSRPSKRKNSDKFRRFACDSMGVRMDAKPILAASMVCGRHRLAKLCYQGNESNLAVLKEMYENWSFFRTMIDNLQMALAKADLLIAKEYGSLVKESAIAERIFNLIKEEYELTSSIILQITGQQEILDNVPVIQESIRLRNPYVDPLSYMQVELLTELRALRENNEDDAILLREVLLTINGIAAGLRNTG